MIKIGDHLKSISIVNVLVVHHNHNRKGNPHHNEGHQHYKKRFGHSTLVPHNHRMLPIQRTHLIVVQFAQNGTVSHQHHPQRQPNQQHHDQIPIKWHNLTIFSAKRFVKVAPVAFAIIPVDRKRKGRSESHQPAESSCHRYTGILKASLGRQYDRRQPVVADDAQCQNGRD